MSAPYFILAFFTSTWIAYITIRVAHALRLGADDRGGVHKFHTHWVPRLGGIPLLVSVVSTLLIWAWVSASQVDTTVRLIVCLFPAFAIGLVEDMTHSAGVQTRLVFTMISAALGWWLLDARLVRVDLSLVDRLLTLSAFLPLALTLVAASGLAHAVNIIDGYNGLSSFFAAAACLVLSFVAWRVGDAFVLRAALLTAAAALGFMVWNFPHGRIFMGDAGAYLVGFLIGELSILLVRHNAQVSPWFPMLIAAYPVTETLFSIYRKKMLRQMSPGQPDGLHFHMLIYKRLVKATFSADPARQKLLHNSATSIYSWALTLLTVIPALLFWDQRDRLIGFCALFSISYLWLYWRIVRFRTPAILIMRGHRPIENIPQA